MNPETWRRIDQILDRVFDADEADRESILEEECGDDALRRQVESLLAAESRTGLLDSDLSEEPSLFVRALDGALDGTFERGDAATMTSTERRFGPYRVIRMLGAGGMGVVYEGWDTRLERPVAIKVLPQGVSGGVSHAGAEAEAEERFLREARAASALDHANICSIYDIGVAEAGTLDEGRTFLVMALYRGETLRERIERGLLELDEAVGLARQIARGLARAHEAGIVHRDVKPANVFVTEHGEAKILDFGLAKMIDEAGLTRTGEVLGTPAYMSPEQLLGQEVDARADIWAFGVLLYRMVAGARPFPTSSVASLNAVLSRDPEPLLTHRPDTPPELAQLVKRCLEKDPERRPQSMREILDVLGDTPTATTRWTQTVQPPDRSKRRVLWAATAMVFMVVAAVGWRLWDRGATTPESRSSEIAASTAPADSAQAVATESEPTGLVVLPFNDLAPDPDGGDDAGLGRVITEMLVTDLRGSPDLAVASTSRLHRALEAVGWSDDEPPSPQTMHELSEEVGRDTVLHGSYILNGDRYRILATLESMTGESVLMTKQVESTKAGLFNAVDELSLAVREALRARSVGSGGVASVTTNSLDAMAAYSKGLTLYYEQQDQDALLAFRQAIQIDPDFAMAWRSLGLTLLNQGQALEGRAAMERAFELSDRLSPKLRFPVRADHYGSRWAGQGRAIETYREGLSLYPKETAWRNNLGYALTLLERYDEAAEQFQLSIQQGTLFGYAWVNLALVEAAAGRPEEAVETLSAYAERFPGEWTWQGELASLFAVVGNLDDAAAHLQRAQELSAERRPFLDLVAWRIHTLKEELPEARLAAERLSAAQGPEDRQLGRLAAARSHLIQGRTALALEALQDPSGAQGGQSLSQQDLRIRLLLETGEAEAALSAASQLQERGRNGWFERRAIALAAEASAATGQVDQADRLVAELETLLSDDNVVDQRLRLHLLGRLALRRGDLEEAKLRLSAAADLLAPRGIQFAVVPPDHVAIWYDLARCLLLAGDEDLARQTFERAAHAGFERLAEPLAWTRSLYWLGELEFRRGRAQEARRHLARYVDLRREGDLEHEWLSNAQRRLADL